MEWHEPMESLSPNRSACEVNQQCSDECNSILACKHAQQSNQRDGRRGGRSDTDEVVDQSHRDTENEREQIGFHDVVTLGTGR